MLDKKTIQEIENFISNEPKSINEISIKLKKNWRTIDRYIKQIEEDYGTIQTKTFRGGTRGALKIAYLSNPEKISLTKFQEDLENQIMLLKKKEEFSNFDIFQHVPEKDKNIIIEKNSKNLKRTKELINLLNKTKKELKIFSGNLSWINEKNEETLFETIEKLFQKNIKIKIISRVDFSGIKNIKKILQLNYKYGKELIEIRHREQSLRGFLIDEKIIFLKDIENPTGKINELEEKKLISYIIKNKEWNQWLSKIFAKMFNKSIGSEKRILEINNILKW